MRGSARRIVLLVAAAAAAWSCGGGSDNPSSSSSSSVTSGSGGMDAGGPAGIPCDVEAVLTKHCRLCHSDPPTNMVPMPLVSYDDVTAPSKSMPSKSRIAYGVERMKSTTKQMPPPPAEPIPAAEIATVEAWVNAGVPKGDCIPAKGPWDGPPVCTTGQYWTQGNMTVPLPGELMHPGMACLDCHQKMAAKALTLGGTVFPSGREPDDCDGANMGTVEITDANNQVLTLPINANGNFYYPTAMGQVAFPLKARILNGGKEGNPGANIMFGDCNFCHRPYGENGAPGRLLLP